MNFTKMEGLGNDYVYIDCTKMNEEQIAEMSKIARKISDRHFGVGSDGLILICSSEVADFKMKMFNSDGTEAEMCGNGIRCVGKYVYDKGLTQKENVTVETLAGIKKLKFNIENGKVKTVIVDMEKPILDAELIPVIAERSPVVGLKIKALDKEFKVTCVSMGNPHAVTIVDDVDNFEIEKYGPILEKDEHFPKKANIEFIQIIDEDNIKMRVWERGTGETLACGTGACAVCVACTLNKLVKEKEFISIHLLGGILKIKWDDTVYMEGPATTVFQGQI